MATQMDKELAISLLVNHVLEQGRTNRLLSFVPGQVQMRAHIKESEYTKEEDINKRERVYFLYNARKLFYIVISTC